MPSQPDPTIPAWTDFAGSYINEDYYGPLLGGFSVQQAVYNTLEQWLPAYIAEVNRNLGGNILQIPIEYRLRPSFRPWTKDVTAAILCVVNGTVGEPERYNNGYRATWETDVSVYLYGSQDWQETQALTFAYGACIRAALIQNPGLGGLANATLWVKERYLEGAHEGTRTIGMLIITFEVTVPNNVSTFGGLPLPPFTAAGEPIGPSVLPPPDIPVVEDYDITVENTEVG
jgi:hypothetical protein